MIKQYFQNKLIEAGCDEAGRGCLAGPVFAAAVILPKNFYHQDLNDSKKLSESKRNELASIIKENAISYAVGKVSEQHIDRINILNASFLAMHRAIDLLQKTPQILLIDGNRFTPYKDIPHHCIIKGDGKYASIAAASILAKTARDQYMTKISELFPLYKWNQNKGYATQAHRLALLKNGPSPHHRQSFSVKNQLLLPFDHT